MTLPSGTPKKVTNRLTVDALRYYVPIFQEGEAAEAALLNPERELTPQERLSLQVKLRRKELAAERIGDLCGPLITRELKKLISNSHLRTREDVFDLLYYAGLDGMKRGLRKFEVEKLTSSSTNYLFQWIVTYARKELITLEAPYGIPPSRFQRYKKISAVRKKLTEQQGAYATNDEVLAYFKSGQADLKTLQGRVRDHDKPSRANQAITLELVAEQERFEKEMMNTSLLDPLEDYSADALLSQRDEPPFAETVFGVFTATYPVTEKARVVIMSELSTRYLQPQEVKILDALSVKEYRTLSTQWKNLVRDAGGPFYSFLRNNREAQFAQFDVAEALRSIEAYDKKINPALYEVLFERTTP